MRLTCPNCGTRDLREFTYHGHALTRPVGQVWSEAWDDYIHLRDNPAGESREFWCHDPCGTFAVQTRDTVSHAALHVAMPQDAAP